MTARKKYDLAVKLGTYTDRNGDEKGRWENIGAVMQGDNGYYMMLKRTFNAAGVPGQDDRDSILVSMFEPKNQQSGQQQQVPAQQQPAFDDDIPF